MSYAVGMGEVRGVFSRLQPDSCVTWDTLTELYPLQTRDRWDAPSASGRTLRLSRLLSQAINLRWAYVCNTQWVPLLVYPMFEFKMYGCWYFFRSVVQNDAVSDKRAYGPRWFWHQHPGQPRKDVLARRCLRRVGLYTGARPVVLKTWVNMHYTSTKTPGYVFVACYIQSS